MKRCAKLFPLLLLLTFIACKKNSSVPVDAAATTTIRSGIRPLAALVTRTENFETGTKTAYTAADVTLSTGVWNLNDALIGNTTADKKKRH